MDHATVAKSRLVCRTEGWELSLAGLVCCSLVPDRAHLGMCRRTLCGVGSTCVLVNHTQTRCSVRYAADSRQQATGKRRANLSTCPTYAASADGLSRMRQKHRRWKHSLCPVLN